MAWLITGIAPQETTISLADFLDSIEMNGLPQFRGDFWKDTGGGSIGSRIRTTTIVEVASACAMGQAALNLEVDYHALTVTINSLFRTDRGRKGLADAIIGRNDGMKWGYKSIANFYRKAFADRLDERFRITKTISVQKGI